MITCASRYLFRREFLGIFLLYSSTAFAWGERGHDTITRVAVRLLAERPEGKTLHDAMLKREHMLAHLSNVPDTVWRAGDQQTARTNLSTHFIALYALSDKPSFSDFPFAVSAAKALATKNNKDLFTEVGTAPWRIRQLFDLTKTALSAIKPDASGAAAPTDVVSPLTDNALLPAGIMAHFVGDLSQPLHSAKNYDGWDSKQGGLHSYFESKVASQFDLRFDYEVFAYATLNKPFNTELLRSIPATKRENTKKDPLAIAVALAILSSSYASELERIDKRYAILAPSKDENLKIPAMRRPPSQAAKHFRQYTMKRLALGADTLAAMWLLAWQEAGKPDLKNYASYNYPVAPEFIAPDYIEP